MKNLINWTEEKKIEYYLKSKKIRENIKLVDQKNLLEDTTFEHYIDYYLYYCVDQDLVLYKQDLAGILFNMFRVKIDITKSVNEIMEHQISKFQKEIFLQKYKDFEYE